MTIQKMRLVDSYISYMSNYWMFGYPMAHMFGHIYIYISHLSTLFDTSWTWFRMAQKPPFLCQFWGHNSTIFHQFWPKDARYCCRGRWLQWYFGLGSSALPDRSLGAARVCVQRGDWEMGIYTGDYIYGLWDIWVSIHNGICVGMWEAQQDPFRVSPKLG